jgi:hypothetical protein
MGLSYCEGCHQLEGKTKEDDEGNIECAYCGDLIINVPEHDDYDMER